MNTDDLMNNINQLKTFQELEKCLFDAERNFSDESAMAAYVYLITDSWIIQDGGYESLQSARKCRDFILKLCPDKIKKLGVPGNAAFILPPEKFLLTIADTYKKLACLFKAETRDVQKINEFDGSFYAKQYWHILESGPIGIKGNAEEESQFAVACAHLIRATYLTEEYRLMMSDESIAKKIKDYTGKNNGCLNFVAVFAVIVLIFVITVA